MVLLKMPSSPNQYFSKTIEKGLSILSLFDREHTRLTLAEISQKTDINKTSTYRFVNTLVQLGYLKKNANSKLLKLGPKSLLLGHNFIHGFDLLQNIKPLIDKTFVEHRISIDSALLDGLQLLALYRREAPNTITFRQPLISRDLHARAMGKAVLAYFDPNTLQQFFESVSLYKYTPNTITKKNKLKAELEETKNRGYSINNQEFMLGLICIGAPLMNFKTKKVVGGISFDFPTSEQSLSSIEGKFTGMLTKLACDISEMITIADN